MNMFHCHISESSIEKVNEVLRSGWVSEGQKVKEFEKALTSKLGLKNPVAVNSGTSALHLGLILAGVGPGRSSGYYGEHVPEEVILPAQTFIATGMAVLMCGAVPVFADIDPITGCIDPDYVRRKAANHKTKAIIPVHWGGRVCDLLHLMDAPIVEDAAHALGASYKGIPIGTCSDFTAFSCQATKMLTTGDGGILCCRDDDMKKEAMKRRWFGMDRDAPIGPTGERECDVENVGYKYHMNDIAAAIGLGNLEDFPQRWFRRQEIARKYREGLTGVPDIVVPPVDNDRTHAYYFFSIVVKKGRDELLKRLNSYSVASVVNRRIDRFKVFGGMRDLPGQAEYERTHLALPTHEGVTDNTVEMILEGIVNGRWRK